MRTRERRDVRERREAAAHEMYEHCAYGMQGRTPRAVRMHSTISVSGHRSSMYSAEDLTFTLLFQHF